MELVADDQPHPDDRPPEGRSTRIPAGLWWAVALAVVVLAIAGWQALGTPPPTSAPADDVVRLPPPGSTVLATVPGLVPDLDPVGSPVPSAGWTRFDGAPASLADYQGRPLVVNFWASWCVPCVSEMPAFEAAHQQFGDDVAFVGINVNDTTDAATALVERTGVTYDLGRDPTGALFQQVGGVVMPTTLLVDRDGTVVWATSGAVKPDDLTREIKERLRP